MKPRKSAAGGTENPGSLQALRAVVRERLELELLTLSARDRPALLRQLDDSGEPLAPEQREVLVGELEVLDRRVAAIRRYLGQSHEPVHATHAHVDGAVVLDDGEGPRLTLVAELPVPESDLVAADSPLGTALVGESAGADVGFRTPRGPRNAKLLEVVD